jgi:hypothetical protein
VCGQKLAAHVLVCPVDVHRLFVQQYMMGWR